MVLKLIIKTFLILDMDICLLRKIFTFIYTRIVSNTSEFERYTGIPREIARAGFNSGETDLAGVGYENDF